ncbi:metal ABC transporter substrate-binding protein [filamentous cyanobacterium LEGE 11480]|uniref:Metal ABC transporter substrate-binding protein n=1 Tax=Romeriopsis navalis LEGE 11480 TaxID=2777977 RepID=A0A928Z5Z1_9CYAN|nr:metal ABC transporter substrate-binding protein [Romeriopsis navalis]MBE9031760.1 metal ABC transporter substrate-binding protein [Romeriopsis navalis LEGE 11480]
MNDKRWNTLATIIIGLVLGSCRQTAPSNTNQSSPTTVLTTFSIIADMAQNVAGDKAAVQSLLKPGAEIHSYEPTPSDLVRGQKAKLIFDNGLNLELWADRFYSSLPKVKRVTLSEGIKPVAIGADGNDGAGAYTGKPNPHAWMSPKNAQRYVANIQQALSDLDPANTATYKANAESYNRQIAALDQRLKQTIAKIPVNKRYLVTCEGAFSYLARDYGLKEAYLWPVNAEQQGTPQQVKRVIRTIQRQNIPAVFCESTVSDKPQRQVAKESGARFAGTLYVDSLSTVDGPASTYLKLLEHNVNTIIAGLAPKS